MKAIYLIIPRIMAKKKKIHLTPKIHAIKADHKKQENEARN